MPLPDDLRPAAVRLWHDCGLTRPWNDPEQDLARALLGPSSTVLACVDADGLLAGTVMVGSDGHRGWLYYLAVGPAYRGHGLGRLLVRAAERWLVERNVPKVQLMVRHGSEPVLGFYQRLGYEPAEAVVLGRRLR